MTQEFKVGDKVRLTGDAWDHTAGEHNTGDIAEIISLDHLGRSLLEGGWIAYQEGGRWATELVTDKEQTEEKEWVEIEDWSTVSEGDTVKVTGNGIDVVGTAQYMEASNVEVKIGDQSMLDVYADEGFTLSVEATRLEPGYYLAPDRLSGVLYYTGKKMLYTANSEGATFIEVSLADYQGDLVKLEPVST